MTPEQIRTTRQRLGLSRTQFAARLSVDADTVAKWERGERRPSGLLARALHDLEREMAEAPRS